MFIVEQRYVKYWTFLRNDRVQVVYACVLLFFSPSSVFGTGQRAVTHSGEDQGRYSKSEATGLTILDLTILAPVD